MENRSFKELLVEAVKGKAKKVYSEAEIKEKLAKIQVNDFIYLVNSTMGNEFSFVNLDKSNEVEEMWRGFSAYEITSSLVEYSNVITPNTHYIAYCRVHDYIRDMVAFRNVNDIKPWIEKLIKGETNSEWFDSAFEKFFEYIMDDYKEDSDSLNYYGI